eukprot:364247-Chlamydomonas_euryale.AAC.20
MRQVATGFITRASVGRGSHTKVGPKKRNAESAGWALGVALTSLALPDERERQHIARGCCSHASRDLTLVFSTQHFHMLDTLRGPHALANWHQSKIL